MKYENQDAIKVPGPSDSRVIPGTTWIEFKDKAFEPKTYVDKSKIITVKDGPVFQYRIKQDLLTEGKLDNNRPNTVIKTKQDAIDVLNGWISRHWGGASGAVVVATMAAASNPKNPALIAAVTFLGAAAGATIKGLVENFRKEKDMKESFIDQVNAHLDLLEGANIVIGDKVIFVGPRVKTGAYEKKYDALIGKRGRVVQLSGRKAVVKFNNIDVIGNAKRGETVEATNAGTLVPVEYLKK